MPDFFIEVVISKKASNLLWARSNAPYFDGGVTLDEDRFLVKLQRKTLNAILSASTDQDKTISDVIERIAVQ